MDVSDVAVIHMEQLGEMVAALGVLCVRLKHLNPRRLTVVFAERADLPAVSVEIRVGFMSHTFTTACPDHEHPHLDYSRQNDPRIFSHKRCLWSHHLPKILDTMADQRCYVSNTGHGNHFVVFGNWSPERSACKDKPRHLGGVCRPVPLEYPTLRRLQLLRTTLNSRR